MPDISIERQDEGNKARYIATVDGVAGIGELTISKANDHLIIADHTETPRAMRGMGVGTALARRLVQDARAADQKVIPLCPFVKSFAQRYPAEVVGVIN